MTQPTPADRRSIQGWVRACLVLFFVMGLGFGTWLSRLPSLRDELGASTIEMSIYGLCLAGGSLAGLLISGRLIERLGSRRVMTGTVAVQVLALPCAVGLIVSGQVPLGLIVLFVYGFTFSSTDIAMNVSGANAERALGVPRLPLMHASYSIGSVLAMGAGAASEAWRISLLPHFVAVAAVIGMCGFWALRLVPRDESALRAGSTPRTLDMTGGVPVVESWTGDTLATVTGSIPVIPHADAGVTPPTKAPRYNPWRDRRILAIGAITLVAGLLDGAASDWLPLALVDGRGVSNEFGTLMLGLFFGAIVLVRLSGSVLLARFGRVTVLRASLVCAAAGVLIVTLLPGTPAIIIGTIAWGLGAGLCWPISISAAADNANTAVQNVAVVSAIGYTSMLLGPMAFGFIGEYTGLLRAFWLLPLFALIAVLLATASKSEGEARSSH